VRLFSVSPGWLQQDFSAPWTIRRPWQSLTEPPALVFVFDVDVAGEVGRDALEFELDQTKQELLA
jgi:hypothetical protein